MMGEVWTLTPDNSYRTHRVVPDGAETAARPVQSPRRAEVARHSWCRSRRTRGKPHETVKTKIRCRNPRPEA